MNPAYFAGSVFGCIVSSLMAHGLGLLVLRKAPPALHGLGAGFGYGVFIVGMWGDPSHLPPVWEAAAYAAGTAIMYAALSVLRKPRRARVPEALVAFAVIACLFVAVGPRLAKSTFAEAEAFACEAAFKRNLPNTALSARLEYCRCVLAPVLARCPTGMASAWDRDAYAACDRAHIAGLNTPEGAREYYQMVDECRSQHLPPDTAAQLAELTVEGLLTQYVTMLAGSDELAKLPAEHRRPFTDCYVREILRRTNSHTPLKAYETLIEEKTLDETTAASAAATCRTGIARPAAASQ